jgi:HAD superfamily hydrolase (TIGR01549 family)
MTKPQVLFFDCWYTLFEGDMVSDLRRITALLQAPLDRQFLKQFEQVFMATPYPDLRTPAALLLQELGRPASSEIALQISQIMEESLDYQRPYPDTLSSLEILRKTYELGLITNSHSVGFEHLRGHYDLDSRFDYVIPSYEIGAVKPEPAIFQRALDLAGIPPSAACMIGDSPADDITGARTAGMDGVLLDRRGRFPDHPRRITRLSELGPLLEM